LVEREVVLGGIEGGGIREGVVATFHHDGGYDSGYYCIEMRKKQMLKISDRG
jgi:hypothetical protein